MGFLNNLGGDTGPVFGRNLPPWMVPYRVSPAEAGYSSAPSDKAKAHQSLFTRSRIFAALQALGAPDDAPAPPHAPEWMAMPQPRFSGLLDPHIGQPQLMPAPAWMQPYLWGGR